MNEQAAIKAACALTGDPVEAVLAHRLTEDAITLVIDRGIKGAPKFIYALTDLKPEPEAKPEPEPEPEAPAKPVRERNTRTRKTTKKSE